MESEVKKSEYLRFFLCSSQYALATENIKAVIELNRIKEVPAKPGFMKGFIDFRGIDIPVIDLRILFGVADLWDISKSDLIILKIITRENIAVNTGIIVDSVKDVINIPLNHIDKTEAAELKVKEEYITGICEHNNNMIFIVDIDDVLYVEDLALTDSNETAHWF